MYRFHPQVQRLIEVARSGELGELRSIRATLSFVLETQGSGRRTRQGGGGAIADVGCYPIDFANWVAGQDPVQIRLNGAHLEQAHEAEVESRASASLLYPSGLRADLDFSIDQPSANLWEIRGELGAVAAGRHDTQGDGPAEVIRISDESLLTRETIPLPRGGLDQFALEMAGFRDVIAGRSAAPIAPEQSIRNARVLEELRSQLNN